MCCCCCAVVEDDIDTFAAAAAAAVGNHATCLYPLKYRVCRCRDQGIFCLLWWVKIDELQKIIKTISRSRVQNFSAEMLVL